MRNISTNISALGQRTHLKLGELSSLFIAYNITIFLLYPFHSFLFYFLLRNSAQTQKVGPNSISAQFVSLPLRMYGMQRTLLFTRITRNLVLGTREASQSQTFRHVALDAISRPHSASSNSQTAVRLFGLDVNRGAIVVSVRPLLQACSIRGVRP